MDETQTKKVIMLDRSANIAIIGEPFKEKVKNRRLIKRATYIFEVTHIKHDYEEGEGCYALVSKDNIIIGIVCGIDDIQERWSK